MTLTNASAQRTGVPDAEALRADPIARLAGLPVSQVEVVASVGSTNHDLLQRPWERDLASPRVLVALDQTAGRGRRGRIWTSDPASSLTFSVSVEWAMPQAAPRLDGLSVRTGLAIAEHLGVEIPGLGLKWPNDLQRDGRKVAGLLLESRLQGDRVRVVAGLGVNLWLDPALQAGIDQPVGALFESRPTAAGRVRVLGGLIRAILGAYEASSQPDARSLAARWACWDVLRGNPVVILFEGRTLHAGTALGIDEDGALRLEEADGERRITSGEVSVRRQNPLQDGGDRQ